MLSSKKASRYGGILILLGIVCGILSVVPSVESPSFLSEVFPNKNQVLTGATFQFFLVPIYIGFALLLYPLLRQANKSLAIGFVGFRMMSGVFQLIGLILLPVFILLSDKYLNGDLATIAYAQNTGEILRYVRDLVNHMGVMVATGLGNLLLFGLLIKNNMAPKWLSVWGILGNFLLLIGSFLLLFQQIEVISPEYGVLTVPLVIQEIAFAIWLIVKGIKPVE